MFRRPSKIFRGAVASSRRLNWLYKHPTRPPKHGSFLRLAAMLRKTVTNLDAALGKNPLKHKKVLGIRALCVG